MVSIKSSQLPIGKLQIDSSDMDSVIQKIMHCIQLSPETI